MSAEVGVLMGVVEVDGKEAKVGIGIIGQPSISLSIDQAGFIFGQLGDLLESLGYFECEDPSCAVHHPDADPQIKH